MTLPWTDFLAHDNKDEIKNSAMIAWANLLSLTFNHPAATDTFSREELKCPKMK